MRKVLPLLLFVCFALMSFGQTVPEVQRTLLTKKTATWCSFCGSWGWTAFEKVIDDNEDKAIMLGAHFSGDLMSTTAQRYMNNLTGSGQPRFYSNNTDLRLSSSNYNSKLTTLKTQVSETFDNTAPIANAASDVFDNGDGTITANTKTTFFQDADGEYNVVVYVLENNVRNNQSGRGVSDHPFVLRAQMGDETFGEQVVDGVVTAGTSIQKSFDFTVDGKWNMDNLFFATIVWKNDGGSGYDFVNGTQEDEFSVVTSQNDARGINEFVIAPNIITNHSTITIDVDNAISGNIKIYDLLGHEVLNVFSGTLRGQNRFELSRDQFGDAGLYIVTAKVGSEVYNKRIMIK